MDQETMTDAGIDQAVASDNFITEQTTVMKPRKRRGWIIAGSILLALVLMVALSIYILFFWNRFSLEITLNGEAHMVLDYGTAYQEPGADVKIRGSRFWTDGLSPEDLTLEISTDLQEDELGTYTVTYTSAYHYWKASRTRTVEIVDREAPVITLVEESGETILPGQPYVEEGFTAVDNYDGDITSLVRTLQDTEMITYVAVDSSGNLSYAERKIPYYDPLPPKIHLEGGEEITISCGTIFEDPGFTASDNADGDITDRVVCEGEVTWYVPGTYPLSYTVSDVYGNETVVNRIVTVEAVPRPEVNYPQYGTIYLTFDDGPGPHTGRLLDVLKKYGVKATFFVMDTGWDSMMARIVREGHSIGIHTMTHDYQTIYSSPEAFFADLYGMQEIIYRNTGIRTTLMRFPGGGSNMVSYFNKGIMTTLSEVVQDAGFQYFDWNIDSLDAGGAKKKEDVVYNVTKSVPKVSFSVVLQHDTHSFSVDAVEDIILWGLNNGYTFRALKPDSPPAHHTVQN